MYLKNLLIENSGAIEKLYVEPQFHTDGSPKPLVLVGTNGSGKTGLLSTVADGIIEVAALKYLNVTPHVGGQRRFYKVTGGRAQRQGCTYELALLKFSDGALTYQYVSKAGTGVPALSQAELNIFQVATQLAGPPNKIILGPPNDVERIFDTGAYAFFPSSRSETPHWANSMILDKEPTGEFESKFVGQLNKPLVVQSSFSELKPWIMNLFLDMIVSYPDIFALDKDELIQRATQNATYSVTYQGLIHILRLILGRENASIQWVGRAAGDRKIAITEGNKILMPSIDSLSTGQATLFSIFATLLRYGDTGMGTRTLNNIEGVFIIDEVDSHLHADLQHEVLPHLIRSFPKVQFILTAHSALFPLGMRKILGEDGFTLLELPTGLTISAERYCEFETSFAYIKATQKFEASIVDAIKTSHKPLVLCEGKTDPKYLLYAATALEISGLSGSIEFDWIGLDSNVGDKGGGKDSLNKALAFLRYNPGLIPRPIMLLYDCDANKAPEVFGDRLFVYSLPRNRGNTTRPNGIENLLPDAVFEERFFSSNMTFSGGGDKIIKQELKKNELCDYLCTEKRDAADFENFRTPLQEIKRMLLPGLSVDPELTPN